MLRCSLAVLALASAFASPALAASDGTASTRVLHPADPGLAPDPRQTLEERRPELIPPKSASDGTEPDPVLTPGAVRTTDRAEIVGERTAQVRNVTGAEKLAVYRRYGMKGPHDAIPGTDHMAPFEIDHRVPLCAGGANDVTNLWVEAGDGAWTFHDKDRLEDRVCTKLKKGLVTVEQAQAVFLGDWKAGYVAEFGGAPQHGGEAR